MKTIGSGSDFKRIEKYLGKKISVLALINESISHFSSWLTLAIPKASYFVTF